MIDLTIGGDRAFRSSIESTFFFTTMTSPDGDELWCLNGIRLEHLCGRLLASRRRSAAAVGAHFEENVAEERDETSSVNNERLMIAEDDDVSFNRKPSSKRGRTREKSKTKRKKTTSAKNPTMLSTDTLTEDALEAERFSSDPNLERKSNDAEEVSSIVNDGGAITDVGHDDASSIVQEFEYDFEERVVEVGPFIKDLPGQNGILFTGLDEKSLPVDPLLTPPASDARRDLANDDEDRKSVSLTETFETLQDHACHPVADNNCTETSISMPNYDKRELLTDNDASIIKDTENDTRKPECMADSVSDISDERSGRGQKSEIEVAYDEQNEFSFRSSDWGTLSQQTSSKSSLETVSSDRLAAAEKTNGDADAKDKARGLRDETSVKASSTARPTRRQPNVSRSSTGKQVPMKGSRTSRNASVKSDSSPTFVRGGGRRSYSIGFRTAADDPDNNLLLRSGRTLSVDQINRCFEQRGRAARIRRRSLSVERCLITLTTTTETTVIRSTTVDNDDVAVDGKPRDKDPIGGGVECNLGSNGSVNSGRSSGFDFSDGGRTPETGEQLSGCYDSASTGDSVLRNDTREDRPASDRVLIASDRSRVVESEDIAVEVGALREDETPKVDCVHVSPFFETLSTDRDENERFTLVGCNHGQNESRIRTGIDERLQNSHEQENFAAEARRASEDDSPSEDVADYSGSSELSTGNSQAMERIENDGMDPYLLELQKSANGGHLKEIVRANYSSDSQDSQQIESEHEDTLANGQISALDTISPNKDMPMHTKDSDLRPSVSLQFISKHEDIASKPLLPQTEGDLPAERPVEKLPENRSETPPENTKLNDSSSKESSIFTKITQPAVICPSPDDAGSNPSNEKPDTTDSRTEDDNNRSNKPLVQTLNNKVPSISDDDDDKSHAQKPTLKASRPTRPPPPPPLPPSSPPSAHPVSEFTEKSVQDEDGNGVLRWESSDCVSGTVFHEYAEVVWFYRNYFMTLQSSASSSSSPSSDDDDDVPNEGSDSVVRQNRRSAKLGARSRRRSRQDVQLLRFHAPNFTWTWRDVRVRSPSHGGGRGAVAHLDHVTTLVLRPVGPPVERFDLVEL